MRQFPSLAEFQQAAVTAINAATSLDVYNHVPQDTQRDYIVVSIGSGSDNSDKDAGGFDLSLVVTIWMQKKGDLLPLQQADLIIPALVDSGLSTATGEAVCLDFVSYVASVDPGGHDHFCTLTFDVDYQLL